MTGAGAIPVVPSAGDAGRIEGGHSSGREGNSDGRGREGAENLHCGLLTEYYYEAWSYWMAEREEARGVRQTASWILVLRIIITKTAPLACRPSESSRVESSQSRSPKSSRPLDRPRHSVHMGLPGEVLTHGHACINQQWTLIPRQCLGLTQLRIS